MTTNENLTREIAAAAEAALRGVPAYLQKPGVLLQVSAGAEEGRNPPPCTGKDCTPPCKGWACTNTIIGHDPLLFVIVALVIGLVLGFLLGSRRNR